MSRLHFDADLTFSVSHPAVSGSGTQSATGTIRARGSHIAVQSDDIVAMAGSGSDRALRAVAAGLARQGLTLAVSGPHGTIVVLGAVRSRLLSRLLTRSPYVVVVGWREAWRLRRAQRQGAGSGDEPGLMDLLPPPTVLPLAPTFGRISRQVTTTHDPLGGGRPQLVLSMGPTPTRGDTRKVFRLSPGVTTIGSSTDADLRLDGLAPRHAEIRRDDDDEYRLFALDPEVVTLVNGAAADQHLLRSGARIQLGPWKLSYSRAEFADHGRPYGGREGGELSHQRDQPRPTYGPPQSRTRRR